MAYALTSNFYVAFTKVTLNTHAERAVILLLKTAAQAGVATAHWGLHALTHACT